MKLKLLIEVTTTNRLLTTEKKRERLDSFDGKVTCESND